MKKILFVIISSFVLQMGYGNNSEQYLLMADYDSSGNLNDIFRSQVDRRNSDLQDWGQKNDSFSGCPMCGNSVCSCDYISGRAIGADNYSASLEDDIMMMILYCLIFFLYKQNILSLKRLPVLRKR